MNKTRILVVEDDRIIAEDIKNSLEDSGYEVIAIEASAEGSLARVEQDRPALVLMDIVLRGKMDGIEAAAEIRSRYRIPIVYLTSHADVKTLERAKETAPMGYLIKPFGRKELNATIEIALCKDKMEKEREKLIQELQDALSRIKTLEGILPICSSCKKIRDDNGCWQQMEHYIAEHSEAQFSHGICRKCADTLYGGEDWYEKAVKEGEIPSA